MVTIIESESIMFTNKTKKISFCTSCDEPLSFYSASPVRCIKCGKNVLDYINLMYNSAYKVNYHKGIVDERGTLIMRNF